MDPSEIQMAIVVEKDHNRRAQRLKTCLAAALRTDLVEAARFKDVMGQLSHAAILFLGDHATGRMIRPLAEVRMSRCGVNWGLHRRSVVLWIDEGAAEDADALGEAIRELNDLATEASARVEGLVMAGQHVAATGARMAEIYLDNDHALTEETDIVEVDMGIERALWECRWDLAVASFLLEGVDALQASLS